MPYPYEIFDVFTATPLAGNPLAVVSDAEALDAARMQAVAAEFNLSETIFLHRTGEGFSGRIFTPKGELPFAGHPTVGAAVALAARYGMAEVTIRLPSGVVRARVAAGRAAFDVPQLPTLFAEGLDGAPFARALGLPAEAIGCGAMRPAHVAIGPAFTMVPVDSVARLATAVLADLAPFGAFPSVYVFAPDGAGFRARMFAPTFGIAEDPATGSAAVALAALWQASERPADGVTAIAIAQGVEMGRPSMIGIEVEVKGGLLVRVRLSGEAVRVAEGTLFL